MFYFHRHRIFKNIFAYSSISFLNGLLNFIFISIAAKLMSKSELGVVGLFFAITYFIIPSISFGTSSLVGINIINFNSRKFIRFFNSIATLSVYFLFPIIIIVVILTVYFNMNFLFGFLIIIFSMIRNFINLSDVTLIQKKKIKKYATEKIRTGFLILIIGFLFLKFVTPKWNFYILAFILAEALSVFYRYKKAFVLFRFKNISFLEFKYFFYYGLPLIVGVFGGWVINQSDKIIVDHFFGLEVLGGYTLAFQIGRIIRTFNSAIINALTPYLYESYKEGRYVRSQIKYFIIFFVIGVLLVLGIFVFAKYFFVMIYGNKYADFKNVLILVSVAFFFEGLYKVWDTSLVYLKKNTAKTLILFASGGTGVFLSIYFIPRFHILAPAIGTLCAYFLLFLVTFVYSLKVKKNSHELVI